MPIITPTPPFSQTKITSQRCKTIIAVSRVANLTEKIAHISFFRGSDFPYVGTNNNIDTKEHILEWWLELNNSGYRKRFKS